MGASVRLGRILGVPVRLHFSWFIIFVLFAFVFEGYFSGQNGSWSAAETWLAGVATSLLLFVSVLVHELSHSMVAIRRGVPVKGITLFILGGVSHIEREADRPSTEFIVAIAGPLSSILVGFLFLGLAAGSDGLSQHVSEVAWILFPVNIGLVVLNMLPGFPMDGGRVLRAFVWRITRDYCRASRLASTVGQAVAFAIIATGVAIAVLDRSYMVQGTLWVTMGIFLHTLASASHRQFRLRESLQGYRARDVMVTGCAAVPEGITLSDLARDYENGPDGPIRERPEFFVLTRDARALGIVTRREIDQVPRQKWPEARATAVMVPMDKMDVVGPDDPAWSALEVMEGKGVKRVLVIEDEGVLGFIARDTIRQFATSGGRLRV